MPKFEDINIEKLQDEYSINVLKIIYNFEDILTQVTNKEEPSILARYLIDLAKPYMPLFKRKFLNINGVEIKERVYGQKQEVIKCELMYNIDTNNVEGIKIYNNEGTTYPALESRAMGLTRFISLVDNKRFIVWSYLMSSVRLDEPALLNVVERGDSLIQYQGERG